MKSRCFPLAVLLVLVVPASGASVAGFAPLTAPAIRIVNCDQKVPSRKRGVCANRLEPQDFSALAPGVGWFYNWHFTTKDKPSGGSGSLQFIPMVWGDREADLAGLRKYLETTPKKPRAILAINEPNLKGQAFIPPKETAALYAKTKAIADRFKIPLVAPNMALGSPTGGSISAFDPVEKQETTYTFMVPFLKAFLFYTEASRTEVGALAFHSYGSLGELRWAVESMYKEFHRPIWVTEYAQWSTPNTEAARKYLIEATNFLESSPQVEGYAWFKERAANNPGISLFEKQPGKLSPLGEAYVALPPHDTDLYYRIPGRLQAENYAGSAMTSISPTIDTNGVFRMTSDATGAWLDYNLQVDRAGTYLLKFRCGGALGKIEVLKGGALLGTAETTQKDWHTVLTAIQLPNGAQTLRVRCTLANQAINWIEFARK